jgi:hypothetical protein
VGLVDDEVDDAREVQSSSVAHRNSSSVVFRLTLGMVCTDWVRALLRYGLGSVVVVPGDDMNITQPHVCSYGFMLYFVCRKNV